MMLSSVVYALHSDSNLNPVSTRNSAQNSRDHPTATGRPTRIHSYPRADTTRRSRHARSRLPHWPGPVQIGSVASARRVIRALSGPIRRSVGPFVSALDTNRNLASRLGEMRLHALAQQGQDSSVVLPLSAALGGSCFQFKLHSFSAGLPASDSLCNSPSGP
jgi:hypothetical protein